MTFFRTAPRRGFLTALSAGLCGCASWRAQQVAAVVGAPQRFVVRASQYAVSSDVKLSADDPLLGDLAGLRDAVADELALPAGRTPIRVLLFESETDYTAFLQRNFPELPPRRAFFVQQGESDLAVLAWRGDELRRDLRHEATHALLHSTLPHVPLWLDEGLAEYFELGPHRAAGNPRHAQQLLEAWQSGWRPDLRRLEILDDVARFQGQDYRESWMWVHWLLQGDPIRKRVFLDHFKTLRAGKPAPLTTRLGSGPAIEWEDVLKVVASTPTNEAEADLYKRCRPGYWWR